MNFLKYVNKRFWKDEKGITVRFLILLLLALAGLVLAIIVIAIFTGHGSGAINFIKNLFRFGVRI